MSDFTYTFEKGDVLRLSIVEAADNFGLRLTCECQLPETDPYTILLSRENVRDLVEAMRHRLPVLIVSGRHDEDFLTVVPNMNAWYFPMFGYLAAAIFFGTEKWVLLHNALTKLVRKWEKADGCTGS